MEWVKKNWIVLTIAAVVVVMVVWKWDTIKGWVSK